MTMVAAFRSDDNYTLKYALWIHSLLPKNYDAVYFPDMDIAEVKTIPFKYNWRGWRSKIKIFNPDDVFYMDLDAIIIGDTSKALANRRKAKLRMLTLNTLNPINFVHSLHPPANSKTGMNV